MIQGVIFDMDGLLLDTERVWDRIWPVCFQQLGLPEPPKSFYTEGRGLSGTDFQLHLTQYYPHQDTERILKKVRMLSKDTFAQEIPVKPGAEELLKYLENKGIPRILASSSSRSLIQQNLKKTGLMHYFCDIVSGQDVTHSKPNPQIFILAAKKMKVQITNCLVLEDSFNGVRAGHESGAITIMVPDLAQPNQQIQQLYHYCCRDLFEVKKLLEQGTL